MKKFERGDRVVYTDTGEKGTVRVQFIDGYVALDLDDGTPAEYDSMSLEKIE